MITLYSSKTLDGLCSAAIIFRHATLSNLPVQFSGFIRPVSVTRDLTNLVKTKKKLYFFLDLPFSEEHLPIFESLLKTNKIVYWTGPQESVKPPAKFIDSAPKTCSAELTMKRFLPNDPIAKRLAQMAKDVKFWKLEETDAAKLADLIRFEYPPNEMIKALSRGVFWNEKFQEYYDEHYQKKVEAIEDMMGNLVIKHYLKYRFGFALVSSLVKSAEACQHILDTHAGVDVALTFYRDGTVTFRKRETCPLNLRELAEIFGGGGHLFASGARLDTPVTKENYTDALFKLDRAIKNALVPDTLKKETNSIEQHDIHTP